MAGKSSILNAPFVLRLLLLLLLCLHGTFRIRYDRSEVVIFVKQYGYPPKVMPFYGATQVLAGLLSMFIPVVGLPLVAALAVFEGCSHVIRQRQPMGALMDAGLGLTALYVGYFNELAPTALLAAGVLLGAAMFAVFDRRFARPASLAKQSQ